MKSMEPPSPAKLARSGQPAYSFKIQAALNEKMAALVGRNVLVQGRRTVMRLEPLMWSALEDIAAREDISINDLCSLIQQRLVQTAVERGVNPAARDVTLTSGVRVFINAYFRTAANEIIVGTTPEQIFPGNDANMEKKQGSVDDLIGCVGYSGPPIRAEDMDVAVGHAIAQRWRHG